LSSFGYVSRSSVLIFDGIPWEVNSAKSGIRVKQFESLISQLGVMQSYHNKVLVLRFDLHFIYKYTATKNNKIITIFTRRLFKFLKSHYKLKRIGYHWTREHERGKKQHYHFALVLDANKVIYPSVICERIEIICSDLGLRPWFDIKHRYRILKRGNEDDKREVIYWLSYLAKARGKGYKNSQVKNYGSSRLKLKNYSNYI